jgi:uncharacterized protein YcnI
MKHIVQKLVLGLIGAVVLTISLSSSVLAHVVVSPNQVETAGFQTFTISVPNEKDSGTTTVKLTMPSGLNYVTPTTKVGWDIAIGRNDANNSVTEITWSGGTIAAGFRDEFTFSAQVPAKPTELTWKAYQTYADGTVVSWDTTNNETNHDSQDSNIGPASNTKVVTTASQAELSDTGADESSTSNRATIIAVSAIAISFVALYFNTRKR